jgi:hypothetical protein
LSEFEIRKIDCSQCFTTLKKFEEAVKVLREKNYLVPRSIVAVKLKPIDQRFSNQITRTSFGKVIATNLKAGDLRTRKKHLVK